MTPVRAAKAWGMRHRFGVTLAAAGLAHASLLLWDAKAPPGPSRTPRYVLEIDVVTLERSETDVTQDVQRGAATPPEAHWEATRSRLTPGSGSGSRSDFAAPEDSLVQEPAELAASPSGLEGSPEEALDAPGTNPPARKAVRLALGAADLLTMARRSTPNPSPKKSTR